MNAGERRDGERKSTRALPALFAAAVLVLPVAACSRNNRPPRPTDTIWDSPLLDRRIEETPRERTLRQCRQESRRFRVECTACHTTDKEREIRTENLKLTGLGYRARVMRQSVTFGKYTHCTKCHTTQFGLTSYAQRMFGPEGEKHRAMEAELNRTTIK